MNKFLSVLSLLALLGLGATQLSFAGDATTDSTIESATAEAAAATVESVADAAVAVEGAVDEAVDAATTTAAPVEAAAAPVPVPNKGDTAWMIVATVLVTLMVIPGLALFYGGLVRQKNMLSVLMQTFVIFSLMGVLWALYGYSVAFTGGNPFFGGLVRRF